MQIVQDKAIEDGWFWTEGIMPNGLSCRTLVQGGGLNDRLAFISYQSTLPLWQVAELPDEYFL